ncbi:T-cell surface glycoprotein CD3 zeta chain-like [Thalassophryne amazonica]|uniref:T-cell surface glycoprotein CD3 zeta chain-like n=1 Tax=Thalassophryne amazonica TaxID=390379 RepID=UPI0014726382|nr:T-cell surface glycoprotein CD3 zeta chain-like [Thalassophryne amazonica]
MASLRISVLVLAVLILPVSTSTDRYYVTDPITCYILDGVLIIYCIAATALYIREKIKNLPPLYDTEPHKEDAGIYQDLNRPKDADPYQVLQSKGKAGKKKKSKSREPKDKEKDAYETLMPISPPQAPQ